MTELFDELRDPSPADQADGPDPPAGSIVAVALAANLWDDYDYRWPDAFGEPQRGMRVHVPLGKGNRKTLGFVVDPLRRDRGHTLKTVLDVLDHEPPFDDVLWKLGQWISHYYLTPLGQTLAAMVPAAVGQRGRREETVVYLLKDNPADWPARLGPKQKRALDELLEARKQGVEPLTLETLCRHSGAPRQSIRSLAKRELVRFDTQAVTLQAPPAGQIEPEFDLSDDQQVALNALTPRLAGGFSATLLHGVTGSGKTEVYVRAIRRVIEQGRQAILLVPEIALATQTLQRLIPRLGRVALLHSGLTDVQRAFYYDQVRDGHADVVIGPRSAVFAPARKLGLIVVDEEHEGSYKQDNAPRYHGRDVAVMRAKLADVPAILGSATPSLESMHNARVGRFELLSLPNRVRGLPMPALEIVRLREEITPGRVELIGRTLTLRIAAALERREQVILLMNRRGYSSFVFCPGCKWEMTCDHCARMMVYHTATRTVTCHYCQSSTDLPDACPACGGKLLLFGMGIQRVEAELGRKFGAGIDEDADVRLARMDSDTMTSPRQFEKVLGRFRDGEIDILLGTQMVAKGLDFPRVSLVGVVSGDTSLSIPDFRAAERTLQLIVQVAGRAGRADTPGRVVVQTLHPDEPAIQFAAVHDYAGFFELEAAQRREASLPPFRRMVRFIVRHRDVEKAQAAAGQLAGQLRHRLPMRRITMYGPQLAGISKIKDHFRFEVLLIVAEAGMVQRALSPHMAALHRACSPGEVVADVDPLNLV